MASSSNKAAPAEFVKVHGVCALNLIQRDQEMQVMHDTRLLGIEARHVESNDSGTARRVLERLD